MTHLSVADPCQHFRPYYASNVISPMPRADASGQLWAVALAQSEGPQQARGFERCFRKVAWTDLDQFWDHWIIFVSLEMGKAFGV
jgi:hypothetical protein